jgi:hypothetical protein
LDRYLSGPAKYNHSKKKDKRFIQEHNCSTLQKINSKYMESVNLTTIVTKILVLVKEEPTMNESETSKHNKDIAGLLYLSLVKLPDKATQSN